MIQRLILALNGTDTKTLDCTLPLKYYCVSLRPLNLRGFLGIRTFAHILSDPRVQDIPLILETPSFEKPREVWGNEIQVLQRLSGIETEDHSNLSDTKEKELTDSVREVIKLVGGSTAKKSRTSKATANRRKSDHHDSDEVVGDEE